MALRVTFYMQRIENGEMVNLSDRIGVKTLPYTCMSLSDMLVDSSQLTVNFN